GGGVRGGGGGGGAGRGGVGVALEALADGSVGRERIESRCASEGAVEVLIEPQVPAPLLAVVGDAPAARTLRALAAVLGWRTTPAVERADAVVIASMGRSDEEALESALASGARDIRPGASAKRGAAGAPAVAGR